MANKLVTNEGADCISRVVAKKNVEIQFNHISLYARLRGSGKPSIFIEVREDPDSRIAFWAKVWIFPFRKNQEQIFCHNSVFKNGCNPDPLEGCIPYLTSFHG